MLIMIPPKKKLWGIFRKEAKLILPLVSNIDFKFKLGASIRKDKDINHWSASNKLSN